MIQMIFVQFLSTIPSKKGMYEVALLEIKYCMKTREEFFATDADKTIKIEQEVFLPSQLTLFKKFSANFEECVKAFNTSQSYMRFEKRDKYYVCINEVDNATVELSDTLSYLFDFNQPNVKPKHELAATHEADLAY